MTAKIHSTKNYEFTLEPGGEVVIKRKNGGFYHQHNEIEARELEGLLNFLVDVKVEQHESCYAD
jgi:hypothetical protein